MARLFVLDAMGLAYRAYHALLVRREKTADEIAAEQVERPGKRVDPYKWEPLRNSRGDATNAILGFANTVLKLRREEKPDYWALAWDGPGPTFRHERFADYKATRRPIPEDLLTQIEPIEQMAQALGLPLIEVPGMEADDVMATLARRGEQDGLEVVLVTSDKDMLQLVNERVRLLSPIGRGEEYAWVDRSTVIQKWGVPPEAVRDVLALMGDSIDNVPGVPGIGEKTATELMKEFGSLDAVYENLERVKKPSVRSKLEAHREQALLSRELVTVRTDCELPYSWEELRVAPIRRDALRQLTTRYQLGALEKRVIDLAVADEQAGAVVPGRANGRRGTAAETPAPGVRLTEPEKPLSRTWARPAPRVEAEPSPILSPPAESPRKEPPPSQPRMEPPAAEPPRAEPPPVEPPRIEPPPAGPPRSEPPSAERREPRATAGGQEALDLWSFETGAAESAPAPPAESGDTLATLIERLDAVRARAIHGLALFPVAEGDDPRTARLVGVAVAARDGTASYVPLAHDAGSNLPLDRVWEWLALALDDPTVEKVSADLKRDLHLLARVGLVIAGPGVDLRLASFVTDPVRGHDLESLARDVLGVAPPPLFATGAAPAGRRGDAPGPSALGVAEAAAAAARTAQLLFPIADALRAQLETREQWALYERLEHPLVPVLLDMERAGVLVDRLLLEQMSARAADEIARLERELHEMAGGPINLLSGPQLARTLFETLGLKTGRRTKTGYSTDQAVLEELAAAHPFPARLLEYRALAKLKSTYLDALPGAIDPRDQRVHTSYNQAGAATGRLSSSNPNLQNVPMRTPLGRSIRKAFIAPPGHVLVGADYSQIELRVMAHLSGDAGLIEAFRSGEDVHASTARKVFGVTSELDPGLRARAKVVNFGVMYGMGPRSLSQQMGISLGEAQDFIANYFRVFAGVREFLDRTIAEARQRGYVQTLLGRRRYLPGLESPNGAERANSERAAINAPIQGSAADLMKLAMIRVHAALKRHQPSARLLLQVHDELVLETRADEADAVSTLVRAEMEGCFPLRVPLIVSVGHGPTWFDVH